MSTPWTGVVLRPGHRGVLDHVGVDVGHLIYLKQPAIYFVSETLFGKEFSNFLQDKNGSPSPLIFRGELNEIFPRE